MSGKKAFSVAAVDVMLAKKDRSSDRGFLPTTQLSSFLTLSEPILDNHLCLALQVLRMILPFSALQTRTKIR